MNYVPENVNAFVEECSSIVGNYEQELFYMSAMSGIEDRTSPIEQLFESAILALTQIIGEKCDFFRGGKGWTFSGVQICPQHKIGKYKADYLLCKMKTDVVNNTKGHIDIVVELDGHAFHDKDERQRRYEKKRDREMQKLGYKVFRYTGAEIVKDPFAAAIECVSYMTNHDEDDLRDLLDAHKQHRSL